MSSAATARPIVASACRASRPGRAARHGRDRGLPHGGAGRPCRAVRRLRAGPHRLQLVPQPALPEVPGLARAEWLAARQAELLPVPYFHVVFTLPAAVAEIAFQNKAMVYAILFRAAAETLCTIAADPRISAPRSAWSRCCTPGGRTCIIIPTSIASSPAADCRPTARAGSPAGRASSCRCACSRGCSGGCSSSELQAAFEPASSASPATSPAWPSQAAFERHLGELAPARMGRLRQAALRRPRAGARLSRPLHPSRRHRQQPARSLDDGQVSFRWKDYATTASPRS